MMFASIMIAFVVNLLVVPPLIYFGVPLGVQRESVTPQEAVAVALVGIVVTGMVSLIFGWIPLVGGLLVPFTWVGCVKYLCPVNWPTAAAIGLLSWAIPVIFFTIAMAI